MVKPRPTEKKALLGRARRLTRSCSSFSSCSAPRCPLASRRGRGARGAREVRRAVEGLLLGCLWWGGSADGRRVSSAVLEVWQHAHWVMRFGIVALTTAPWPLPRLRADPASWSQPGLPRPEPGCSCELVPGAVRPGGGRECQAAWQASV